jgi:alkanesulfonate monooxygenase SsuD/methylene tetrahydromethanopterin reductase-like flavin-dependent oxidoreductase (luciferase family)
MRLGLLLPNQGVVFGAISVPDLLAMADVAEQSDVFDDLFVGDNLLAKPRLESVVLLSALAGRTRRCRLGTACMASFPLRHPVVLAAQWAALDCISEGRTLLVACMGGGGAAGHVAGAFGSEYTAMGIAPSERPARLEEGIQVLRTLWTQDPANHEGEFYRFSGVTLRPRPVQQPCPPIWLASNPHLFGPPQPGVINRQVDRVARLADGWMTIGCTPEEFGQSWSGIRAAAQAHGRDPAAMQCGLYYNLNINDDRAAAFAESKRFLDEYYSTDFPEERLKLWTAYGAPDECLVRMREFAAAGVQTMVIRFLSYDQPAQLRRFIAEVAPRL